MEKSHGFTPDTVCASGQDDDFVFEGVEVRVVDLDVCHLVLVDLLLDGYVFVSV